MTEHVTVTIEGAQVSVPKGTSIIEAAKQAGVLIPHYCYHPSLPSPAVCRMCLVEVEKAPKLMPACVTTVADGQVVHVNSAPAKAAREGVLEFLLANHPLDCPICDQAGECELQDYTYQEGRAEGRHDAFPKRYNPVEEFGPDVLYVPNRCILCTRCVRFMDDVAKDTVLNVEERGDRATIGIFPDRELDHPWAGNVVDLCPVGSLISRDFLHKARAWDLDRTPSVCPGCTQGCNITIDTRDNTVVRFRPRANLEVNRHFMCDEGRMNYRWLNRGDRIEAPLVLEGDRHRAVDWETALARLAQVARGGSGRAVVLASGRASLESLGWLSRLLGGYQVTAAVQVPIGEEAPLDGVPGLALRAERAPNLTGARLLGFDADWSAALDAAGKASLVVLFDVTLTDAELGRLAGAGNVVVLGTVDSEAWARATLVLPVTTMAEEMGAWMNRDGRVQRYQQAKAAPGMARPGWWVAAGAIGAAGDGSDLPATTAQAFDALGGFWPALGGMSYQALGLSGRVAEAGAGAAP
jgi:NADH-quinone oxidoreductase subunit G